MKTINRTALTVTPQQPYLDWANSFDDDGPKIDAESIHATSILISEKYDEYNYEKFLKSHHKEIFELELHAWNTDPDTWPKNRSYKTFMKWFRVVPSEMVFEMGKGPILKED